MASPFAVFRKHQKVLIATLGLLAMIAFVILPNILQQLGMGGPSANPIVVTSKHGNLTEYQLENMRNRRQRVVNFLQMAVDAAALDPASAYHTKRTLAQLFGNTGEESIVDLWILVQRAKQLGMTISNDAVSNFIGNVTSNRVTNQQFAQLYKNLKISEDIVYDTLQDELLAMELRDSFTVTLAPTPPGLRWEYYQRLNRKVNISVAAVPVADYADQIEDPDDEVLEKFFEEHKDQFADPNSPEPGFRVPAKVSVEYIKADFNKYTDVVPVTDEEIEEYYMKNRDQRFVKTELPGLDEGDAAKPKDAKPAEKPKEKPAEKPSDTQPADDSKYQPLEEVRAEITEILNAEKQAKSIEAFKKLETALQPIRAAVSKYHDVWKLHRVADEKEGAKEPPKKPDFDALAKQQSLTFHETGLVSHLEMGGLDIGLSMVEGRQFFPDHIFNSSDMYRPKLCSDLTSNVYLFWKTDSTDERVPKFDDDENMRDKVLAVWKTVQARALAQKEAEKLAGEARKSKKTLEESLENRVAVQKSGPFSWFTRGPIGPQGQSRLMLSNVERIDRPGDDFMRAVYNLEIGQVGVAMNQPQTIAYVVQLEKTEPSDTVLWIGFKADPYSEYASVGGSDQRRILKTWTEGIRKDAKLDWKRKPIPPAKNRQR